MGYDPVSNLVQRVDADGRTLNMGYDGARRLSTLMPNADPWIYYAYDAVSARTEFRDETGLSIHAVDKLDRFTSKTNISGTVYYQYDRSGMKVLLTDPGGKTSYYAHDAAGRLLFVLLDGTRPTYFGYDASSLVTAKVLSGNNTISYFTYDAASRMSVEQNLMPDLSIFSYFAYARDPNGRLLSTTRESTKNPQLVYYVYDGLDRLVSEIWRSGASAPNFNFYYGYDAASNRQFKSDVAVGTTSYYGYDKRNLLASEAAKTGASEVDQYYDYDSSQRMTTQRGAASQYYFTYNQRNMVSQVQNLYPTGSPDANRYFSYTGTGERAVVYDGGGPHYWAYDGRKLIQDKASATPNRYRHNDAPLAASVVEVDTSDGDTITYISHDEGGSLRQLLSAVSGLSYYDYDAAGLRLIAVDAVKPRTQWAAGSALRLTAVNQEMYVLSGGGLWIPRISMDITGGKGTSGMTINADGAPPTTGLREPAAPCPPGEFVGPDGQCQMPTEDDHKLYGENVAMLPKCGPTVDDWFARQLRVLRNAADDVWYDIFATASATPKDFLEFEKSYKFEQTRPSIRVDDCPSTQCPQTATLCGVCLEDHQLGNIAYGYVSFDYFALEVWGAILAASGALQSMRGFNAPSKVQAYWIGFGLRMAVLGGASIATGADLCRAIRTNIHGPTPTEIDKIVQDVEWWDRRAYGYRGQIQQWRNTHPGQDPILLIRQGLSQFVGLGGLLSRSDCATCASMFDGPDEYFRLPPPSAKRDIGSMGVSPANPSGPVTPRQW